MNKEVIKNPILPGFYPDPSICRVDDDYYMITSSFELYPGIPIFHSKDLANWEQIGYALDKSNDFHVVANVYAGGVMAPTIRYHKGVYYIINANFGDRGNFIIKAENPAGPWSKPIWLDDVKDLDVSLFFDNDDKVYIVYPSNTDNNDKGFHGERGIFLREIDINTFKLIGEPIQIWDSALRNASAPEAPHLYHIEDYYYLVIAEGGTEHYHSVTVARSKELKAWFEGYQGNPVMTHRHLGFNYPIDNVGHADLVETASGQWYAVMLGSRIIEGQHKNLGRETYICPVVWERGWPVFSPNSGKIELEYPMPENHTWTPFEKDDEFDDFDSETLNYCWNFWGTPYTDFWKIENSCLKLKCVDRSMTRELEPLLMGKPDMRKDTNISLIARRQLDINFEASCKIKFNPTGEEAAGIIIMQAFNHHFRIEKIKIEDELVLRVIQVTTNFNVPPYVPGFKSNSSEVLLAERIVKEEEVILCIKAKGQDYEFLYGENKESLTPICKADGKVINPEFVGGMVGILIGMFATGNGKDCNKYAEFDWFEYKELV